MSARLRLEELPPHMFGFGWVTLRQAQEALQAGRLEEALRLLAAPGAQGRRGLPTLLAQLARAFAERAERQLRGDDVAGAWRDLLQAEKIQPGDSAAEKLRLALTRLGTTEIRAALEAGDPIRAREAGLRLRQHQGRGPELEALEALCRAWIVGRELAERGEFASARAEIDRVHDHNATPNERLERERNEWTQNEPLLHDCLQRLYLAGDAARWREVIEIAEQALRLAPQHPEARRLRTLAWRKVEPDTLPSPVSEPARTTPIPPEVSPRYLLWIDGVGGFLVCLGQRLTLGQSLPDNPIEIPLVADVSRLHAGLNRDAEGWMLEALRPVKVNNQETPRALLKSGDRITLGHSCQLVFHQPVPVSTTARLNLASGHRLPLALDGVILMGETMLLGSGSQVHITVPDLRRSLILFRHRDGLGVRAEGSALTINGQNGTNRAILGQRAQIEGDDIGFAVEPVGVRLG